LADVTDNEPANCLPALYSWGMPPSKLVRGASVHTVLTRTYFYICTCVFECMQQTMLQLAQDTCMTASTYPIAQVYTYVALHSSCITVAHLCTALPCSWCTVLCHQLQHSFYALLVHTHTSPPNCAVTDHYQTSCKQSCQMQTSLKLCYIPYVIITYTD